MPIQFASNFLNGISICSLCMNVIYFTYRLFRTDGVKDLRFKDKDKDLEIGPRGSSRTRTFPEDNKTAFF